MASDTSSVPANEGKLLVSGATKVDDDASQRPCHLLELPAELRNKIYEYALSELSTIDLTAGPQLPPLLSTCKEIRIEALGIWYSCNRFTIDVDGCNPTLILWFEQHLERLGVNLDTAKNVRPYTVVLDQPCWENLMRWCYYVWNGDMPYLNLDNTAMDWLIVVEAAHGIAAAGGGSPWEIVKAQLQPLRKVAGIVDERRLR